MSQLALDLIEKEKQERTGYLDLGNCGLTELPQELFELRHLHILILSNEYWDYEKEKWIISPNQGSQNYLLQLPNEMVKLNQLKKLVCGGHQTIWETKNIELLGKLPQLTWLYLSENQISDYSFLSNLSQLTTLYLILNRISDVSFLSSLTSLTTLDISGNQISDASFLSGLSQLTSLDIRDNQISDVGFLSGLSQLISLNLSRNQISRIDSLLNLPQLTSLDISDNQIWDVGFLQYLPQLTSLNLSNNQILNVSSLSDLFQLITLDLSGNKISDISFLSNLPQLTWVYLSHNQISHIDSLLNLPQLTTLDLSGNQISDCNFLSSLSQLTSLDLSGNQISDIGFLSGLPQLTSLSLRYNQISDCSFLSSLSQLTSLELSSNQISDIGFLSGFPQLTSLDLSDNQISDLSVLEELKQLHTVYLKRNPITKGISMEAPDSSIDFLKAWLEKKRIEDSIVFYVPTKVLLLGNHAAGKSCLLHYFKTKELKTAQSDSTHILNIDQIILNEADKATISRQNDEVMPLYVYDFGGQDFYHGFYQAFTNSASFQLLLFNNGSNINRYCQDANGRNQINHDIRFWLGEKNYLESTPNDYFVVQTHADQDAAIYLDYKNFDNEPKGVFHISTQQNERKLRNLWDSLLEALPVKEERGSKVRDFYGEIYRNTVDNSSLIVYKIVGNKLVKRNTKIQLDKDTKPDVFLSILRELNRAGVIFLDEERNIVFGNPEKLINEIHHQVLTPDFISNGKISQRSLRVKVKKISDVYPEEIIRFLEKQKTIFLENESQLYIFPNFLPLFQEDPERDFFELDTRTLLFAIQFKHFIPFGMINQIVSHFGKQPNKKRFWRDRIFFNLYSGQEKQATVSVILDILKLKIKVYGHILKDMNKVKSYLLESILEMYRQRENRLMMYEQFSKKKSFPSIKLKDFVDTVDSHGNAFVYFDYVFPKDSQLSIDDEFFVDAEEFQKQILEEEIPNHLVLKNADNQVKIIPTFTFGLFTTKEIKKMKKIFISYSRKDDEFKNELKKYLGMLSLYQIADNWSCEEITPGLWHEQIQKELAEADAIVFMLSMNFFSSSYIMSDEVKIGIEMAKEDPNKKIICVIVRTFPSISANRFLGQKNALTIEDGMMYYLEEVKRYQFLPYDNDIKSELEKGKKSALKPLEDWPNISKPLSQIVEKIEEVLR